MQKSERLVEMFHKSVQQRQSWTHFLRNTKATGEVKYSLSHSLTPSSSLSFPQLLFHFLTHPHSLAYSFTHSLFSHFLLTLSFSQLLFPSLSFPHLQLSHFLAYSFTLSLLIPSLTHSFPHLLFHSITHSLTLSFPDLLSFQHFLSHCITYSLISSLTHSII